MCPSEEVNDAVGEAPPKPNLEQRAAELRKIISTPSPEAKARAELRQVEAELAERREAAAREQARERMVALSRADGSFAAQQKELAAEEAALEAQLAGKKAQKAEVVGKRVRVRDEVEALVDRFGVAPAKLQQFEGPRTSRAWRSPHVERCEHGVRARRTYHEVRDTPSAAIITTAGLKPWAELTERQRQVVAERAEERRRDEEAAARFRAEVATEAAALRASSIRGAGAPGTVHHG